MTAKYYTIESALHNIARPGRLTKVEVFDLLKDREYPEDLYVIEHAGDPELTHRRVRGDEWIEANTHVTRVLNG